MSNEEIVSWVLDRLEDLARQQEYIDTVKEDLLALAQEQDQ